MKRLIALTFLLALTLGSIRADEWKSLGSSQPVAAKITLLETSDNQSTVQFSLEGFWLKSVLLNNDERAYTVSVGGASPLLIAGAPDLSKLTASLQIPDLANMEIEVSASAYVDFENIYIAPSKGNLLRNVNPQDVPFTFGEAYGKNAFYPAQIAALRNPYIIRELRGQTVVVTPFQYNPVSHVLRVYTSIEVVVRKTTGNAINTLSVKPLVKLKGNEFDAIYKRQFLNYQSNTDRYVPVVDRGNMLIITYAAFIDALQPFVEWKTKSGIEVEVVDVASIGNSAAIKQYVTNYYNEHGLTFLLLVGDAEQVPPGYSSGDSDNVYAYVVGTDHYPDLFVGRFSAANLGELQTQIDRSLSYEQTPYTGVDWFSKAIGIGSDQGPGDNNEMDYEHIRGIGTTLLDFTYTYTHELFDGSQGGNDQNGNPTPAMVSAALNAGAGIINYTGHGSQGSWGTTGFSSSDVDQLTNDNMLPFIFSVACVNGDFVGTTCFGETWLRATHNGQPTGAIGIMASTINQSWNPPMAGQDEMDLILTEAYADNIRHTMGGIAMNGCMKMNDTYGAGGDEMTDTWLLFGDPSIMLRTASPEALTVTHNPSIFIGVGDFAINCPVDGAFAALSINGQLLGAAEVQDGVATIVFDPIQSPGTATLVVTAFNYIPYTADIEVIPNEGPFVSCTGFTMLDANGNSQADYGEDIQLSLMMSNVGNDDATGVNVLISTNSPYAIITDANEAYGTILANESVTIDNGFALSVANNTPDNTLITIAVTAQDDQQRAVWNSQISFRAYAPIMAITQFIVDDVNGNNNGKLDPGETVNLIVGMINNGGAAATNAFTMLSSPSANIDIAGDPLNDLEILPGIEYSYSFVVTASPDTPQGEITQFDLVTTADLDFNATESFSLIVGQVPVLVIDLAGGTSGEAMQHCISELNVGMDMLSAFPENLSLYSSVFVNLGIYPDNAILSAELGQALAGYLDQGGKLYLEGGDTWAYDQPTAVHPYFGISGTADGSGDLGTINGLAGTFAEGFSFTYSGTNSYIDQLSTNGTTAYAILQNQNPSYVTAIANAAEGYKTIGASCMFSGLTGAEETDQTAFMAQMLGFFGIPYVWTGVDENPGFTGQWVVYPNPMTDKATFTLTTTEHCRVSITLYNLSGQEVATVADQDVPAGTHNFEWTSAASGTLVKGVYFGKLTINNTTTTTKLIKM
ncbi:MAG: T9SS type A sorting domain-containing protein [Bacteroidetes bacterium]|nr:T9SS type A sorting domain-containing protein [Bacteroidota bacterium]